MATPRCFRMSLKNGKTCVAFFERQNSLKPYMTAPIDEIPQWEEFSAIFTDAVACIGQILYIGGRYTLQEFYEAFFRRLAEVRKSKPQHVHVRSTLCAFWVKGWVDLFWNVKTEEVSSIEVTDEGMRVFEIFKDFPNYEPLT